MTKPVDIGYASARQYWDEVVRPTYSRFLARQTREHALDVAKGTWELHDWLWRDTHPGAELRSDPGASKFRESLFSACPELELIRDIAESAKHGGRLGRPTVQVKGITGSGSPGGTCSESSVFGTTEYTPECSLVVDIGAGDCNPKLTDVLAKAVAFWKNKL